MTPEEDLAETLVQGVKNPLIRIQRPLIKVVKKGNIYSICYFTLLNVSFHFIEYIIRTIPLFSWMFSFICYLLHYNCDVLHKRHFWLLPTVGRDRAVSIMVQVFILHWRMSPKWVTAQGSVFLCSILFVLKHVYKGSLKWTEMLIQDICVGKYNWSWKYRFFLFS